MSDNSCDQMFLFLREVCCTIATYMHTLRACIKCTEQTKGETEGGKKEKEKKPVLNRRGYPAAIFSTVPPSLLQPVSPNTIRNSKDRVLSLGSSATFSTVPPSLLQPVSPNTIRNSKDRVLSLGSSATFCVRYYKSGNYSFQTE